MALYVALNADDKMEDDVKKVTTGFFEGGAGTTAVGTLVTSSLSTTQNGYYYNLQLSSTSTDHMSVAFGDKAGSGSNTSADTVMGNTKAIYHQFASMLLEPVNTANADSIDEGFYIQDTSTGSVADSIYVVTFERARMKDRMNRANWTLSLSGSRPTWVGHHSESAAFASESLPGYTWKLTDDSKGKPATKTIAGFRYNIVSGALGDSTGSASVGWFYPDMGVMVFDAKILSGTLPGGPQTVMSSSILRTDDHTTGLAFDTRSEGSADNAGKIAQAIMLAEQVFRNEENQRSTSYFCRAQGPHFNYSNNPTFISSSGDGTNQLNFPDWQGRTKTFITTVGLYDATYNLVAIGRLSKPIFKDRGTEAIIKVNLTY